LLFRTTHGYNFGKDTGGHKFYQVLKDKPVQFIKMPVKVFVESDYKGLYSSDRRYDEYKTSYRYYLMGSDSIFHQIQLNRKSLLKLYPGKRELIENAIGKKPSEDVETSVLLLLEKF
jgi:hypothetical protein